MSIFYVCQNKSWREEVPGGYVWSPKKDSGQRENAGYKMMRNIRKGDFILHQYERKLMQISIAQSDCYEATDPHNAPNEWDKKGYRVDTDYYSFDVPLVVRDYKEALEELHDDEIKYNAFDKNGGKTEPYMCILAKKQAIFLLKEAIKKQTQPEVIKILDKALKEIK